MNILIVDDSKSILNYFNIKFRDTIHNTKFYHCPLQALQDKTPFDIIISDFIMLDMDGFDLIEKLKNLHSDAEYILMSSFVSNDILNKCEEEKITFINKHDDIEKLMNIIERKNNEQRTFI